MKHVNVRELEIGKQYIYRELGEFKVTVVDIASTMDSPQGFSCMLKVDESEDYPDYIGREFNLRAANDMALAYLGANFYELEENTHE